MQSRGDSPVLSPPTVWRQILCLNIAWIAVLVSLIAIPAILTFTLVALAGTLLVLGVSWARQGRPTRPAPSESAAPASRFAAWRLRHL